MCLFLLFFKLFINFSSFTHNLLLIIYTIILKILIPISVINCNTCNFSASDNRVVNQVFLQIKRIGLSHFHIINRIAIILESNQSFCKVRSQTNISVNQKLSFFRFSDTKTYQLIFHKITIFTGNHSAQFTNRANPLHNHICSIKFTVYFNLINKFLHFTNQAFCLVRISFSFFINTATIKTVIFKSHPIFSWFNITKFIININIRRQINIHHINLSDFIFINLFSH